MLSVFALSRAAKPRKIDQASAAGARLPSVMEIRLTLKLAYQIVRFYI
jgi:hypothetical protein